MGRTKGSGMGSVYKRGNKWRGQIQIDGVRLSHTAEKKKDVLDWLAEIRMQGKPKKASEYTVKEWFEIYFEEYFSLKVRENTYNGGYSTIKTHLYPILGECLLSNLTTEKIQQAIPAMFPKKYADGTYRIFYTRLKDGLEYAVNKDVLSRNPAKNVIMPKNGTVKTVDAYTPEEQKKIVEYCKTSNGIDRVFYFLLATGLRVSEAICLTWSDVNLKEGFIDVNKTAVKAKGGIVVQNYPKTEESTRRVYLSENTVNFIRKLYKYRNQRSRLVLANRNGNIYNVSVLRSHWIQTCEKLIIPYKGMHALRHSWATTALNAGVNVAIVSKMLGHKNIATTMNIYQTVFSEQKKEAAKIMNNFV